MEAWFWGCFWGGLIVIIGAELYDLWRSDTGL